MTARLKHYDAVVIGSGLSGLIAATTLAHQGARVYVVAKGGGFLHFTSGCVDVLGRTRDGTPVENPGAAIAGAVAIGSNHPYALAGSSLEAGLQLFQKLTSESNYAFGGSVDRALDMPTAIGSSRRTCLSPRTMEAGNLACGEDMLVVGFRNFRDFYPPYLVANLQSRVPFAVHHLYVDPPEFDDRHHLLSLDAARFFDDPAFRERVGRDVRKSLHGAQRVGFPAVLGLEHAADAHAHLEAIIGVSVFEIPTLPPSVPGIRLQNIFRRHLMRQGVRFEMGFWVTGRLEANRVVHAQVESPANATRYSADAWILATGGVGSGGIAASAGGTLRDTVFGLPAAGPPHRGDWFRPDFLGPDSQPISFAGIATDDRLRAHAGSGAPIENLFVTASNLPGWDPTRERSGEGVAIATGFKAAQEVLRSTRGDTGAVTSMATTARSS
ncbi:MAG: glycerol-3-phosphate dehydrogenase subunit GlpB [Chloroflexota bacterium]